MADSAARRPLGSGWDSDAVLVDDVWVERTARRAEVEPWLRTETRLLPRLAPRLPVPVPEPVVVGEDPLTVRHRLVAGGRWTAPTPAQGHAIGAFLAALHRVGLDGAVARGVPGPERTRDAVLAGYGADAATTGALVARAAHWHRVGPCYAVVHGLDTGDPALVADALAALSARLAPPAPDPPRPSTPPPGAGPRGAARRSRG